MSLHEIWAMAIITALTNVTLLPMTIYFYHRNQPFHYFIAFLTFTSSFMYHFLESIHVDQFILASGSWHRLGIRFLKRQYCFNHDIDWDVQLFG